MLIALVPLIIPGRPWPQAIHRGTPGVYTGVCKQGVPVTTQPKNDITIKY